MTIKEFRQSQGLSQPKLAKALGIGVSTVGGYETGKINPSGKVLAKIKEVFGVDLNAPAEAAPAEKKTRRKAAAPAAKEEKAPAGKAAPKKPAKVEEKKPAEVIIQSPVGGEITVAEILAKVGDVDRVYVRVDQNAAYWVKGDNSGAVNLW